MGEIRKFDESMLAEVAALRLKVFNRRAGVVSRALQEYFREILLCNPWCDEEIHSLAYFHKGSLVGFLGVVPRQMNFEGKTVRVAVVTQMMVDREQYRGFAGFELIQRLFRGAQDLTFTDGATEDAYTVWTAAGGKAARLYSLQWQRVFRPGLYLSGLVERSTQQKLLKAAAHMSRPVFWGTDLALSQLPFGAVARPKSCLQSQTTDADGLLQCIQTIGWKDPLRPMYEAQSFRWLLDQAATAKKHGVLRMAIVRQGSGEPAGWYVYWAKAGGVSSVLQIGARQLDFAATLMALAEDAWEQGASALSGQAIPRYLLPMATKHFVFGYEGNGVLVHTRNPRLLECIMEGDAAISRLDGEWWMRFSVEDWQ